MEFLLKIYGLGILLILMIVNQSATLRIPKPMILDPPEIWLSSYYAMDTFRGIPPDKQFRSQDQFKNDFLSKNGSDYVIFDDTRAVKFTCEADYPVTWKFPFPQQLDYTTYDDIGSRHFRISDFTVDTPDPVNTRFKTAIIIASSSVHFLSVNITCSSVEIRGSPLESSIYVFLSTDKMAIENQGETLHVYLEPSIGHSKNLPPLVLPCRPATPEMKLSLEKQITTSIPVKGSNRATIQKSWKPVNAPEKDLSFGPKIGFTLQRGLLGNRIFGLYKCSVLTSNDDEDSGGEIMDPNQFVLVNVSKSDSLTEISEVRDTMPFESRSFLHGDASVQLEHSKTAELPLLICCSGVKNNPPKLFVEECNSLLKCKLLKETAMELVEPGNEHELQLYQNFQNQIVEKLLPLSRNISSDCSSAPIFGISSVAVCKGINVEFVEQYVSIFHPLASGPVTNRSRRIQEADKLNTTGNATVITSLSHYEPLATAKTAPTSQKILLTVGRQIRRPTKDISRLLTVPIMFVGLKYYYDLGDNYGQEIFESDEILLKKITRASIHIFEYRRDVYYVGEPLIFMCFGLKHFYTRRPHLRLNWSNGTKSLLDLQGKSGNDTAPGMKRRPHILYMNDNVDMFTGEGASLVSIFGNPVTASEEMSSVDCWMPVVNSSKWEKISKPVKVLPSVAPKFLEDAEETIYYYLGDTGKIVTCTLSVGKPVPAVIVTRDGSRLGLKWRVASANETKAGRDKMRKSDTEGNTEEKVGDKRVVTIRVNILNVTHGHQMVIQCLAKNVNGTAERTITVYVLDKPNRALPICLGIAGILCALLLGLGAKHWRDKRTVMALRANNNLSNNNLVIIVN